MAPHVFPLLECPTVGNWKQVQARIRKARVGADAPAKLEQLFLKTRDGMVAFELARVHEAGRREGEALDWYRKAYERFRRDDWRSKAAEAIQRLGGTLPTPSESSLGSGASEHTPTTESPAVPTPPSWAGLPDRLFHEPERPSHSTEEAIASPAETGITEPGEVSHPHDGAQSQPGGTAPGGKRRRRGRRGGRRHRRGDGAAIERPAPQATSVAEEAHVPAPPPRPSAPPPPRAEAVEPSGWVGARAEEMRTRAGDPGLASRVARLEMQVRRLLACPPHKVSDGDLAPAGPGVLLLSDSDLTTHYYICACDTLRIEISRLTRSDRGSRGRGREERPPLRSLLAEHLEISESQVNKYLETHCVVRWLQLDEGAPRVAHFAIAVLEPLLNK